jgi:polar amino acid transport system substrate-binding protein
MPRGRALGWAMWLAVLGGEAAFPAESAPPAEAPLRWAADEEGGAPYIFKDSRDPTRRIGFEVDLADALSAELRRPIEFCQYEFANLVTGLKRGDFDFAMNGIEVTPDRQAALRLSRPYYVYSLQLTVRRSETRFDSLEGCKKVDGVVGTLGDTAAERLLDQMGIRKQVYSGQVEPFQDVDLGRIDAVLLDLPITLYYGKPRGNLKVVGPPIGQGFYAIAFRKDQEELAARIDAALEHLLKEGTLHRIYEKWGLWNDDQLKLERHEAVDSLLRDSQQEWTLNRYLPLLCQGARVTVEITVMSFLLAIALGLPLGLMRLYGRWPVKTIATVYVEFFRGIPVLLLLYFLYYGLPEIARNNAWRWELKLSPMEAAVLGFALNYAAYQAEIFRAGILSIPVGQWEAAASLGMSRWMTFRRIILPQAIRVILPPLTNDLVALFKDTSVVSVIAVVELTKQYQMLSKASLKYLEIGLATAVLYLIMSVPLGYLSRAMERRWGKGA